MTRVRVVKIKNGIGFCANKSCKHLMSLNFEILGEDTKGSVKVKRKFALCDECAMEFLQSIDRKVVT